jgi:glutathione synthase/RimK-type ligase-like ATP-grasp enzyme
MQHIIFAAPILNANAIPTISAITGVPDTRVTVISQDPEDKLPWSARSKLAAFIQVRDALNDQHLYEAAVHARDNTGPIHRMFAANEQVQVPVAIVRERLGIPGMSSEVMRNFRDKSRMKALLTAKEIPCAKFALVSDTDTAWLFVRKVGFPVIVKPPEGAGAEFTYRVEDDDAFRDVLSKHPPSAQPLLIEEFITGEEHSFDAFTVNGKVKWHSITRYLPAPLEVKQNPWMQWRVILPREIDDARYDDIRKVAKKGLKALGADTGISHMEWFRRPDGTSAISEVGMRPPGAQFTTLMSRAHEFNCMDAWAKLMITGTLTPPRQKYAAGCAYLRGQGTGVVRQVLGYDQVNKDIGNLITDVRLPEMGSKPTGSYEGEGFVLVRHPETKVVEDALLHIVSTVRVNLG